MSDIWTEQYLLSLRIGSQERLASRIGHQCVFHVGSIVGVDYSLVFGSGLSLDCHSRRTDTSNARPGKS